MGGVSRHRDPAHMCKSHVLQTPSDPCKTQSDCNASTIPPHGPSTYNEPKAGFEREGEIMTARTVRTRVAATAGMGLLIGTLAVAAVTGIDSNRQAVAQSDGSQTVSVVYGTDDDFDALAYLNDDRNNYVEGVARDFEQARAEAYPYQYWTWAIEKTRDGKQYGHSTYQGKVEGPWVSDYGGGSPILDEEGHMLVAGVTWDRATNTYTVDQPEDPASFGFSARCYACKSSVFNDLYETYGSEAFAMVIDQDVKDFIGGDVTSCGSCHEDADAPSVDNLGSQHIFFNTIIGDDGIDLTMGEKLCGQCHNGTFFTGRCKDDEYFKSEKPFRYGFDADSIIQALKEDGMTFPDEYGVMRAGGMHADLEMFHNGTHDSLGIDCVTCHMPTLEAADGTTFTDHNFSQSPLENSAALETCLGCHQNQGIESADAMVNMVRQKQAEAAERETTLKGRLDELEAAVIEAVKSGNYDEETLNTLRDNLLHADFYNELCWGSPMDDAGIKVAHNPTGLDDYLSRAEKLVDESFAIIETAKK